MSSKYENWFKAALDLRGSIVDRIKIPVVASMMFSLIIKLTYDRFPVIHQPVLGTLIPGIVLGLLLVFRTNTAYERFWEGRKLVGKILILGRNLGRRIFVNIPEKTSTMIQEKHQGLRLIPAFFWAGVLHLRKEPVDQRLQSLLSAEQCQELMPLTHRPLRIAKWISDYLNQLYQQNLIDTVQLANYNDSIDEMVDCLTGCERIINTPMPKAYATHLKHLLGLYCLALPFQFVQDLRWGSIIAVGIITFALLGIEAIGLEIENPFGYDYNDIPLDKIYQSLQNDVEELIAIHDHSTAET
ncbi:MAG: bestrophin family protein [Microcoleaceae cyanobacterium]